MEDANHRTKTYSQTKKFFNQWRGWFVGYMQRKRHKNRPNQEKESPEQRAVRWTMYSTVAIAIFTIALAGVAYLQYKEMRDSGLESSGQTNQMIRVVALKQLQLKRQAEDTHKLAGAAVAQATVAE